MECPFHGPTLLQQVVLSTFKIITGTPCIFQSANDTYIYRNFVAVRRLEYILWGWPMSLYGKYSLNNNHCQSPISAGRNWSGYLEKNNLVIQHIDFTFFLLSYLIPNLLENINPTFRSLDFFLISCFFIIQT